MGKPLTVSSPQIKKILRERFGFDKLRPGQREVINSVLSGAPTLAVMPTGAGKSFCFQLHIDEAHCMSQWGHDFRPAYLSLSEAWKKLGKPLILALTATATPNVNGALPMENVTRVF